MSMALSRRMEIRKPAVESSYGIVASQNRIASEIGADVLRYGGNAIDAAIATSFALGVVEPWMSGIGGGGYMIVRRAGEDCAHVVDFGMKAPSRLRLADYPIVGGDTNDLFPWPAVKDNANVIGAKSVAVPGLVAGMSTAHQAFGSLKWANLVGPSVEQARVGLVVDWYCQLILASAASDLAKFPGSREVFFNADGFPKSSAWTALGQTRCDLSALAESLALIAKEGASTFYHGQLGQKITSELKAAGGRHRDTDLSSYRAKIVAASEISYRNHRVFSTPELTAGPTLEHVLALLEEWEPVGEKPDASAYAAYDSAIRTANAERLRSMGDIEHEPAPSCTTHFSVVDSEGTMVAVTQTLLSMFGSRMVLPETGILMNNGIMWFDPEQGKPNSIGPKKRCLSNMCPTLLERDDGTRVALGAAGGRKIMPAVAQLSSFMLDYGMDLEAAIHTARIDCSIPNVTIADESMCSKVLGELKETLTRLSTGPRTAYPFNFACPSAVARCNRLNSGVSEVMAPWAEAVAAEPVGQQ